MWRAGSRFIVIVLLGPAALMANLGDPLQNGDFADPLTDGWTDFQTVTVNSNGQAVFGEDPGFQSLLEQLFTLPSTAASLSFEYKPLFEAGGNESFSASLLDPGLSAAPLIPTDADPGDSSETYFFLQNSSDGSVLTDLNFVTLTALADGWTKVALDLSALGGLSTDALLAFDFIGFDTSYGSTVLLDNVSVQVSTTPIPAPGAAVLG